ncbi:MAG: hypothetical protein WC703_01145, partial [Candidatus Neomarinimicrobiota bacterium]
MGGAQKVNKFRGEQFSDKDVVLDTLKINQVVQSAQFQNLMKNKEFRSMIQNAEFQNLFTSQDFLRLAQSQEFLKAASQSQFQHQFSSLADLKLTQGLINTLYNLNKSDFSIELTGEAQFQNLMQSKDFQSLMQNQDFLKL